MGLSKVNRSKIKVWLNALESGKYKQGQNDLYIPETNSYCCLGVFAKTLGKDPKKDPKNASSKEIDGQYNMCTKIITDDLVSACIAANDFDKSSFEDIALTLRGHFNIWD